MSINNFDRTSYEERERLSDVLLINLKANQTAIGSMYNVFNADEADCFYRFYHQSFKVFLRQQYIRRVLELFESI